MIEGSLSEFVGARWKILCRHAVSGNLIDGTVLNVASRWWGSVSRDKSVELDVVAESQDKKKVLMTREKSVLDKGRKHIRPRAKGK